MRNKRAACWTGSSAIKFLPSSTAEFKGEERHVSAGRVQSVALKLVVDREKEIDAFNPVEYWNYRRLLQNGKTKNALSVPPSTLSTDKRVEKRSSRRKRVLPHPRYKKQPKA